MDNIIFHFLQDELARCVKLLYGSFNTPQRNSQPEVGRYIRFGGRRLPITLNEFLSLTKKLISKSWSKRYNFETIKLQNASQNYRACVTHANVKHLIFFSHTHPPRICFHSIRDFTNQDNHTCSSKWIANASEAARDVRVQFVNIYEVLCILREWK